MKNPDWYGFNVLWMFWSGGKNPVVNPGCVHIDGNDLDEMSRMGCNFVRLPVDYRYFIHDFKYSEPDERMLCVLDECVRSIVSRGLHCSLNLHRAPGYCINGQELEIHNLWTDKVAQDAFVSLWGMLAERYKDYSCAQLSFDLLNEPPSPGERGLTRENHAELIKRTVKKIREVSPARMLVIDGLGGGHNAIPELADFCAGNNVIQSGRGYTPFALTHYRAEWCKGSEEWEKPVWPDFKCDGKKWNRQALLDFYRPWKELNDKGVAVHIGECGCYNKHENETALAWYRDFFSVLNELDFGFALWNFRGAFGVAEHRREGTCWEMRNGIAFDKDLYSVFVESVHKER